MGCASRVTLLPEYLLLVPSIDVVIVAFNRWDLTELCLGHLRKQTISHSIIVVDNGSTDETSANLHASHPDVRALQLVANGGFPAACNAGVALGRGDFVVLLNNDVEPRPDFLEKLVRPLEEDARVGSAAALLVQPGERQIDCMGLTADSTLAGFPRLRGSPSELAGAPRPVLAGPCGGGAAYRREAWEEVGGLDEGVLFYGEDLDLALRIRIAGWKSVAVPEAVAVHLGSATLGRRSTWQRYQSGFSRGYFLRRYGVLRSRTAPRALATEAVVVAGDAVLGRDLSALRGRLAGWRAAKDASPAPHPPDDAIDTTIGLLESFRLRRAVY